jgi:hypothetical protein
MSTRRHRAYVTLLAAALLAPFAFTTTAEDTAAAGAPNLIGKDFTGWKLKNEKASLWKSAGDVKMDPKNNKELLPTAEPAQTPLLVNDLKEKQHGSDIYTEKEFGDCELHVELLVPKGSNSGVYLMGRYEIQVLDSFGKGKAKPPAKGDLGGIYNTQAPTPDNYEPKPAGEWQTLDVVFRAPKFDAAGAKNTNARFVSVKLNGKEIHKDVDVPKPTGGEISPTEAPEGPVLFQGDHGPVAFRNLRVKETTK